MVFRLRVVMILVAVGTLAYAIRLRALPDQEESWRIEGTLAALRDPKEAVQVRALWELARFKGPEFASKVSSQTAKWIADHWSAKYSPEMRSAALRAYAALGFPDKARLKEIALLLGDPGPRNSNTAR